MSWPAVVEALSPGSPLRGVLTAALTALVLVWIYNATRKRLRAFLESSAHKPDNAETFLRGYAAVWKAVIAIFVLIAAAGSFSLLGLTVGFLGTMLGWSLQAPIRGLAAWVMVVLKRPFRLGDRISVAGVTGDVIDIQLNYIVLNQVGGTVQGEERSGRGILVPTAMLFGENIINYNLFKEDGDSGSEGAAKLMLDEVTVRVTFGSDFELAKKLCIEAAREALQEVLGEAGEEPFTRAEFLPSRMMIRVRYKTVPARRQEVSSRLTELIWKRFREHGDAIDFECPLETVDVARGEKRSPPFVPGAGARKSDAAPDSRELGEKRDAQD